MVKGSRKIWLMKGVGHSGEVGYRQDLSLDKVVTNILMTAKGNSPQV